MDRNVIPYIIQGALFLFLVTNALLKDYNPYRTTIIIWMIVTYVGIAILFHLDKNKKS